MLILCFSSFILNIDLLSGIEWILCIIIINLLLFAQGKWNVPIPKVKGVSEAEVFKVVKTGKTKSNNFFFILSVSFFRIGLTTK